MVYPAINLSMELDQPDTPEGWPHTDEDCAACSEALHAHDRQTRHAGAYEDQSMILLGRSHTAVEHQLYMALLTEVILTGAPACVFSINRLMARTRLRSYSTIRRGLAGLVNKLSIEPVALVDVDEQAQQGVYYRVFTPAEVFARRTAAGLAPYPMELQTYNNAAAYWVEPEQPGGHKHK